MSMCWLRRVVIMCAWPIAGLSGLLTMVSLVLYARNASVLSTPDHLYLADVWIGLVLPPLGAFLVHRLSNVRLGGILLAGGMLALTNTAGQYATYVHLTSAGPSPLADAAAWAAAWAWTPYLLLPTLVVVLFPSGHALTGWWGRFAALVVVVVAATTVAWALAPGRIDGFPRLNNPWGVAGAPWLVPLAGALTAVSTVVLAPVSVLAAALRWRRTHGSERSRMGWFTLAAALMVVTLVMTDSLPYPWQDVTTAAALTMVLGVVVLTSQASAVAADLLRSREQTVRAREDERLRLHRDLHDGLGPELAGIALQIAAVARTERDDDARRQLVESHRRLQELTREVRHVVDGLRPAALESVGLVESLAQCAHLFSADGTLRVTVDAARSLPLLSPAAEVAVFRIATEAMTNTVHHAHAQRCEVRLQSTDDGLDLEIEDDGWGLPPSLPKDGRRGTGLASMRLRAEELGGWLSLTRGPFGGCLVRAHLPGPST